MTKRLLRVPIRLFYTILRSSLTLLGQEHKKLASSTRELDYPPIFIVGPPRSGTTLLYQLMLHRFHLAYFPNIANRFNKSPVLATRFGLRYCRPYVSDFKNNYGLIEGQLMAPHEAGSIWNRWYPTEGNDGYNYTPAGYFDDKTKHIIYQTIAGIEKLFDAPFINKNVKKSVRIQSLVEIFPKALFIQMKRNPFDVANSILKGRKERNKELNDWWSVMPREIEKLRCKNYLEQICGQVFYIEKNIEKDIMKVDKERLDAVYYDNLCANPKKELDKIANFASMHGCNLQIKYEVPESFERSKYRKDSLSTEEEMIRKILIRYYGIGVINGLSWKNL